MTMYTYRQHVRNNVLYVMILFSNFRVWDICLWSLHSYNELNKIQLQIPRRLNITAADYICNIRHFPCLQVLEYETSLCVCYICTMNYKNTVTYNVLYLLKQLNFECWLNVPLQILAKCPLAKCPGFGI